MPCTIGAQREITRGHEALQHLFNEEGVALRELVDRFDEVATRCFAVEDCADHRGKFTHGEALQRELEGRARAIEIREETRERWLDFVVAITQRKCNRLRFKAAGNVKEQLEGGFIAPMNIFDREVDGLRATDLRDGIRDCVKETTTLVLRIECLQRRKIRKERYELWKHPHEFRCSGREDMGGECGRRRVGKATHEI